MSEAPTAQIIDMSHVALHEQVARRLRSMVVEGRIPPGGKLNERELCAQLRVSRTPLREAIKMLAGEGLVDLLPNRGAVAVTLGQEDVLNTFELLASLEGLSGELAAQRATAAELAEVRARHYEMLACFARRDLSGYYGHNAAIHAAISDMARNPVLAGTYRTINARVQFLRFSTNQDEAKWKRAVKEHESMLEALDGRDASGLRRILEQHIDHKRDVVIALMRAGGIPLRSAKA